MQMHSKHMNVTISFDQLL